MNKQMEKSIISLFKDNNKVLAVFVLGSAASDNLKPDSDIDLAILPEGG